MQNSDFITFLNASFPNKCGIPNQWRGENMWVDYFGSFAIVWNANNMRYQHAKFGSPEVPINYDEAAAWISENKDKRLVVPEKYRVHNEYQ